MMVGAVMKRAIISVVTDLVSEKKPPMFVVVFSEAPRPRATPSTATATMGANKPSMLENAWDLLMVTAWLGLVHVAVAVFAVSVVPSPSAACAVLGAYVVAGVWPNAPPYPRWGMRIARAVTEGDEVLPARSSGRTSARTTPPREGHASSHRPRAAQRVASFHRGVREVFLLHRVRIAAAWPALATPAIFVVPSSGSCGRGSGWTPSTGRACPRAAGPALIIPAGRGCLEMRAARRRVSAQAVRVRQAGDSDRRRLMPAFTFGQSETYNCAARSLVLGEDGAPDRRDHPARDSVLGPRRPFVLGASR